MKKLVTAFPLALFSMHALAAETGKAAKAGAEPVMVILFLVGLIVGVAGFVTFMAKSQIKREKEANKQA